MDAVNCGKMGDGEFTMCTLRSEQKRIRQPPSGRLLVHDHDPLPILAIFLDSCNRLWKIEFTLFDKCCVPVRLCTVWDRSHHVGVV